MKRTLSTYGTVKSVLRFIGLDIFKMSKIYILKL